MLFIYLVIVPNMVFANEQTTTGKTPYLEYKEPVISSANSSSSTFFYVISLVAVFLLILLSAWFVSRLLGNKLGANSFSHSGNIVGMIPLDASKKIVFVQIDESLLILGVTEQNISFLKEINDIEEVQRIKEDLYHKNANSGMFGYQSDTLDLLKKKLRPVLRNLPDGKKGDTDK